MQFAALDFNFTDLTRYAYILEDFDQNWQSAGTQRVISYTNLPPGEYTLKIRASNTAESKWFSNICTLRIDIVPAWWQTLWFKIAIAASVVILSYAVHRIRISYLLKQKTQLEKVVRERTRELTDINKQLHNSIEEVNTINTQLNRQQDEIIEKNNEILTQNEELSAQNDHISQQQEKLLETQEQLKEINASLEKIVNDRTVKLQETIHDLDKTVFELDRFVYSASHDLSAPLKSIRGLIEIIHMEKDPGNVYVYTEHIKNTVLKLETVIQSMVDYSRNVHIQVKPETFVLYDLITEVISELTFSAVHGDPVYFNKVQARPAYSKRPGAPQSSAAQPHQQQHQICGQKQRFELDTRRVRTQRSILETPHYRQRHRHTRRISRQDLQYVFSRHRHVQRLGPGPVHSKRDPKQNRRTNKRSVPLWRADKL